MRIAHILLICGLLLPVAARAVYAPIPEQEQGKAWTVSLRASAVHDSNIFGGPSDEISSYVYSASPKVAFNSSVTDQTFVTASYQPTVDHFTDRPGTKDLFSHEVLGRVAHAFSQTTTIDLIDFFQATKNPESLLAGIPLNTDQSFKRNQADARFATNVTEKIAASVKARTTLYRFDNATLGRSLDRTENLYGLAGSYDVLPEAKAVGEYRRQEVAYRVAGGNKDKTSDYFLGGLDYKAAEKLTASARLGVEFRHRDGERSQTAPTAELTLKYDYAQQSYLAAGYSYAVEENSNIAVYTDTKVNRFFVNVQHALTPLIVASGSLNYEPSLLQGRRGQRNADETTVRFGAALSYLPTKNWTLSASYDYDRVRSDDAGREMLRNRAGLSAAYAF
ncbi:MAG: outer membrane beta-barrel protein [Opitutae bacterium]|nr:outer membrane beta-barrel protein [Opitutae bacterium]